MNRHAEDMLDFGMLLRHLADYAESDVTRNAIKKIHPIYDVTLVKRYQKEVSELRTLLHQKDFKGFRGPPDILPALNGLEKKGYCLHAGQIALLGRLINDAHQAVQSITSCENLDHLKEIAGEITLEPALLKRITMSVSKEGDILDTASKKLTAIRKRKYALHEKVRSRMETMAADLYRKGIAQEPLFTIRNNRYVIPVRADGIKHLKGIVHDKSSSGMTLFVEPQSMVQENNVLTGIALDEKNEEKRILAELTCEISLKIDSLFKMFHVLLRIDNVQAKARFAEVLKASEITIVDEPVVKLRNFRNPVLSVLAVSHMKDDEKSDAVVPFDIEIGFEKRCLIVTGPNTGGKTVVLKSIGLAALMVQSGMHPPCDSDSIIGVFSDIYADIGDEQSLEQSLSTFSAHIKNIIHVLRKSDGRSMVLLDELGAGTDPEEGSALGIAVLKELIRRRALVIATTHHDSIKSFAFTSNMVENAAMEFNVRTLQPTYKIKMGRLGQSNAIEIAKRLGFPPPLIEDAKRHLKHRPADAGRMIKALEKAENSARKERKRADRERERARRLRKAREDILKKTENEMNRILDEAADQVHDIIHEAYTIKDTLKKLLRDVRAMKRVSGTRVKDHDNSEAGDRLAVFNEKVKETDKILDDFQEKLEHHLPQKRYTAAPARLQAGDRVRVSNLGCVGELVAIFAGKKATVLIAGKKLSVDPDTLEKVKETKEHKNSESSVGISFEPPDEQGISWRLDLRGKRVDEALNILDTYLDRVYRLGYPSVVIIHGFGTGRLQDAVSQALRKHVLVQSIRPGKPIEGGGGVTIAVLKERP